MQMVAKYEQKWFGDTNSPKQFTQMQYLWEKVQLPSKSQASLDLCSVSPWLQNSLMKLFTHHKLQRFCRLASKFLYFKVALKFNSHLPWLT